jgi:sugar phosphate isomerase/epimerase
MPVNTSETRSDVISYGFSTIGCPEISFSDLGSLVREFDLDFTELRALGGMIDLPGYFAERPLPASDSPMGPFAPRVRLVAANLRLCEATDEDIEQFSRYVDIAIKLRAPYVRVFGGGSWGDSISASQWKLAVEVVDRCRARLRERSAPCDILLETHSAFSSSSMCLHLNDLLDEPLCLLWDAHHTWRSAGEAPKDSWRSIGHLVRHIHFSDSRTKTAKDGGYECVLPGEGGYPVDELRQLLSDVGYAYGVSLEWEKLWHPELPDVRMALKAFQQLLIAPHPGEKHGHTNHLASDL